MDSTLATLLYKLASLGAGSLFCFLGYRLFVLGVFTGGGDMDARFKDSKVLMKKAAPGTMFALFGAVVISVTICRGINFHDHTEDVGR